MTRRWVHAPAGSHWGEFGPDDPLPFEPRGDKP